MALELMKKIDPEQEDPGKKKTLPDVTVVGVRKKKPVDLPEVTVTGVRKKIPSTQASATSVMKKPIEEKATEEKIPYTTSDEYKAILWHKAAGQGGSNSPHKNENKYGRIEAGFPDYNYSEDYYKKKGKEGKMWVRYSDGTIHKLGEKYTPKEHPIKPTSGRAYNGLSWLEWYQSRRQGKEDDFSERKDIKK